MKTFSTPESTHKTLLSEVLKSHNHLGFSAVQWFTWMLDDCLAGFGKKLETPWKDEQNKHLFSLGGLYAEAVIKNPFHDILGNLYQELASGYGKKQLGQYFSPFPVCSMISKMIYSSDIFENKEVVRVAEPAAGSGVMVLAFMSNLMEENPDYLGKLSLTCTDLDLLCVKMCCLQIMANNLIHNINLGELVMLNGNSLGDPKDLSVFYHVSTPDFQSAAKAQDEKDMKINIIPPVVEPVPEDAPEVLHIQPKKQLSIFDFTGA